MLPRTLLLPTIFLPFLVLACSRESAPGPVTGPPIAQAPLSLASLDPNELIAFASTRDGNDEIYVMNPDGTGQMNLTNHAADDFRAAWSPDGSRIAFSSDRDGNEEIYVMNADGSGQTNLTNSAGDDREPDWSPDGTRIAFTSERDGNEEIYVMNADGSGQVNLSNHAAEDRRPVWSPDGARIAFASGRDGALEVYVMNADGTSPTNLTNHPAFDLRPAWSPDGSRIAFSSGRAGTTDVWVMNADGSNPTQLTNSPSADESPAWSSDGTRIAFTTFRDGNAEVYVMNADGTSETNLTNLPGSDVEPAWRPSIGLASGRGVNRHAGNSDQPGAAASFDFQLRVESPPAGFLIYDLGRFRGRLVSDAVSYVRVEDGRIFATGTGSWNGLPNRGWCLTARDRGRRGVDELELLIFHADAGESCRRPRLRFFGTVESGDIIARN